MTLQYKGPLPKKIWQAVFLANIPFELAIFGFLAGTSYEFPQIFAWALAAFVICVLVTLLVWAGDLLLTELFD